MKKRAVLFLSLLLLFGICLWIQYGAIKTAERYYPDAVCYRSDTSVNIGFRDLREEHFSLAAIANVSVEPAGGDAIRVEAYYTDARFADRASLHMVSGSWFATENTIGSNRAVVISEELAVACFFTEEAAGGILTIDGEPYTVCGVYETGDSPWHILSEQDRGTVFFPYTAYADWEYRPCNLLLADPLILPFTNAGASVLQELTGKPLLSDSHTSYPDLLALYVFLQQLLLFGIGLFIIGFLLFFSASSFKKGMLLYKTAPDRSRKPLLLAGGGIAGSLAVWLLTSFAPYIPAALLPSDDLFDFAHYAGLWLDAKRAFHGQRFYDTWWALSFATGETIVFTGIAAFCLFLALALVGMLCVKKQRRR